MCFLLGITIGILQCLLIMELRVRQFDCLKILAWLHGQNQQIKAEAKGEKFY